jgi:hypothetical protein
MRRWPSNDLGITDIKTNLSITAFSVAVVAFALAFTISAQPTQPVAGTPSSLSPTELAERALERHAVEAIIWGMPAVNFDLMYQAMIRDAKAGAGSNKVVYWSKLSDWKNQTLTPNPDAGYFMPFFDTKDVGPVVLEIPPADEGGSITGSVMDCWQAALEDVGPVGVDKGRGGKCLILLPGYNEKIPDGYIVMPSDNFQGYALLRSILQTGGDAGVAKAVAYAKRVNSTRCRRRATRGGRRRRSSSTHLTSCSRRTSRTTPASSSRSTEWCRESRG